jgi:hypothetical protein
VREDYIEKRFDELCSTILDTADLASDYWSGSAADEGMRLCESKIVASLKRIGGLRVILSQYISRSAHNELAQAESALLRETTGGNFGVHNRQPDPQKILSCQAVASDCVITIRRARMSDLRGFRRRG